MTLCDTGPLVALIDQEEQPRHQSCVSVLPRLRPPPVTTWACFTEAMYFLGNRGGLPMQRMLWRFVETGKLRIHSSQEQEIRRSWELMEKYRDTPMDLADATLVAAAETLALTRVFTLDSDFHVYRINGKTSFEVVP